LLTGFLGVRPYSDPYTVLRWEDRGWEDRGWEDRGWEDRGWEDRGCDSGCMKDLSPLGPWALLCKKRLD